MNRVLITGASGYLAGNLLTQLLSTDVQVRCLSRKERPGSVPEKVEWIQGDICEPEIWKKVLPGIDTVFYLAAQTSARWADQNPEEDYKINVVPVLNLIQTAKELSLTKLAVLFAGTATQFGIPKSLPVNENHPDYPITTYDRHKLLAEQALLSAAREGILQAVSLRLCNLYGPGNTSSTHDRGILNQMISRALQGESLTLIEEGAALVRDYLFIADAASAFLCAAAKIREISGHFYVIGTGQGHSLQEAFEKIAARVSQKLGQPVPVVRVKAGLTAIDQRHFVADPSLFIRKTGWKPHYSLDQGIKRMTEEQLCVP